MLLADRFCPTDNPDDDNSPCECRPTDNSRQQPPSFLPPAQQFQTDWSCENAATAGITHFAIAAAAAISPHQWRRTANLRQQNAGLARKLLPQMPPPHIFEGSPPQNAANEVGAVKMASEFRLLTADCRLTTFMPPASPLDAVLPTIHGEKPVRIVLRGHGITREKMCA